MKILALNSSARTGGQSRTELMLRHLAKGMIKAGGEVETVNLREKKVRVCLGCFSCWTKTPGQCVIKDDMTGELFSKWLESDMCIYATPLFHHTVNATMKIFLERTLPITEPFLVEDNERWTHPMRKKYPDAVVLSVAGFPTLSAFDALSNYVNFLFGSKNRRLLAEIYRPGSEFMVEAGKRLDDVLEATEVAGYELVETRSVSNETLARITQPLTDTLEDFSELANCMWRTCIDEGITRKKFEKDKVVPRADSIKTFMLVLQMGFNPKGAGKTKATLQFDLTGRIEGSCHFTISNGTIAAAEGRLDNPALTITSPFDVWRDIASGNADGAQMFMEGKYNADGDMDLLVNLGNFFGRDH